MPDLNHINSVSFILLFKYFTGNSCAVILIPTVFYYFIASLFTDKL